MGQRHRQNGFATLALMKFRLRLLAVNLETSTQDLGEEAVNMLFEKHRLNRIA